MDKYRLSFEGSVMGILATLLWLIPDVPIWRIIILAAGGSLALDIARKSQWANTTNQILTLKNEPAADGGDTFMRKLMAYGFVVAVVIVLGIVTWPPRTIGYAGEGVILSLPDSSQIQYHPTPGPILPKQPTQPTVQSGSGTIPVLGAPNKGNPALVPAAPGSLTVISK